MATPDQKLAADELRELINSIPGEPLINGLCLKQIKAFELGPWDAQAYARAHANLKSQPSPVTSAELRKLIMVLLNEYHESLAAVW